MPNLNDHARRIWDRTTQIVASDEAKASFLQQVDKDSDGKVTGSEIRDLADDNHDGYLDNSEIERLSIKASASDFDRTSIKAMAQAANAMPQLVLFEAEAKPLIESVENMAGGKVPDKDGNTASAEPAAPEPALRTWHTAKGIDELKQSYRTSIAFQPEALPSRNLEALKVVRPGLLRIQDQVGNSCGTTSLSMVLKFWQGHTVENSVPTIDKFIRAKGTLELALPGGKKNIDIDGFTAPRDIVQYAKTNGMRAGMKNEASVSDLKAFLDKGVPVMCLTDWNFAGGSYEKPAEGKPDAKSLHWVDLIGYEYQTNPETKKQELYFLVANPWGVLQHVSESDFKKVWSNLELEIPGGKRVNTGMNRLFVAMVPRDDDAPVVAPNGSATKAGDIAVPTGNDGIKGWLAKKTSDVLQDVSEFQTKLGNKGGQIESEMAAGYDKGGFMGALRNLWNGDQQELANLRAIATRGGVETKVHILEELMNKGINRAGIQQLIYDIIKDTPWGKDFDQLLEKIDTRTLAQKITNDQQAGQILAWIAKSEIDHGGKTGSKFEGFATCLAVDHRHAAIRRFVSDDYTVKGKLMEQVPASLIRDAVKKLSQGITGVGEESAIFEMLKATSWSQFDQIMSRLDMASLASELENDEQLGDVLGWVIDLGVRTSNWTNTSEILNRLGTWSEFSRADNVLGRALTQTGAKDKLAKIPAHLRSRMIDLMDDRTRWRTPDALSALAALKQLK